MYVSSRVVSKFRVLLDRHEFFSAASYVSALELEDAVAVEADEAIAVEEEGAITVNKDERAAAKAVDSCGGDVDGAPPRKKKKKASVFCIATTFCSLLEQCTNPSCVQCNDKESTASEECLGPPRKKGAVGSNKKGKSSKGRKITNKTDKKTVSGVKRVCV